MDDLILQKLEQQAHEAEAAADTAWEDFKFDQTRNHGNRASELIALCHVAELRAARKRAAFEREYRKER